MTPSNAFELGHLNGSKEMGQSNDMAASGYRDYFKVLGIERNANAEAIKRAFRKLARKYHPDVNQGDPKAEARFKEVSEAYEVLSDPEKRRRYEQFGQYWNQSGPGGGGRPGGSGFDVDFGGYGNFDDFINDLLGHFAASPGAGGFSKGSAFPHRPGPSKGTTRGSLNLDAEVKLRVSFAEAFRGAERTLSVNEEKVHLRIPEGVKTGSRLRLKGKGNSQSGTGLRGDLYLNIDVQPHEIWRLDGDQLRADLPVSLDELALGGTVTTITPDGEAIVTIPARTPPGRSLRLKGKGWPSTNGRGDLIFTLKLQLPAQWSNEELQLLEQLQTLRCIDPRQSWIQSARI